MQFKMLIPQLTIMIFGTTVIVSSALTMKQFPTFAASVVQKLKQFSLEDFLRGSPNSRGAEPPKLNLQDVIVVQNETTAQTPANDRMLLLPVIKAAKILGALMYMKSFHKNPFFQLEIDLPPSTEQYYGTSYTTPYPPSSPPPKYPPKTYYPPPPPPMPYGNPYAYNSEEDESEEECESEEQKSSEEECCSQ